MKKQTALDWFAKQFLDKQNGVGSGKSWDQIFNQAKAMEKEQIGKSYQEGLIDGTNHAPKDYYNETYKTDTP